jgi:FkbM family methyltransferase
MMNGTKRFASRYLTLHNTSWHLEVRRISSKLGIPAVANIADVVLFRRFDFWEPAVSRFIRESKGDLFVDIGACYGRITLQAVKNFRRIISIEPDPVNIAVLQGNIAYAHAKNVEILNCAVSDKNGYIGIKIEHNSGWSRIVDSQDEVDINVKTINVATLLHGQKADLIKVDVEGAEWQVLDGALPVIEDIHKWLIELHDRKRKDELTNWLQKHGYCTIWIDHDQIDNDHVFAYKPGTI